MGCDIKCKFEDEDCYCRKCLFSKSCYSIKRARENGRCHNPVNVIQECASYRDHFSLITKGIPRSVKNYMRRNKIKDLDELIEEEN